MRRMRGKSDDPIILLRELVDSLTADPLPSVREQQESLLLLVGDELRERDPAGFLPLPVGKADFITAWVGAFDRKFSVSGDSPITRRWIYQLEGQ